MTPTILTADWAEATALDAASLAAAGQGDEPTAHRGAPGDDRGAGAGVWHPARDAQPTVDASAHAELRASLASFEAQLVALYAEREEQTVEADALRAAVASLDAQLREYYALQERAGGQPLADVVDAAASFRAQLDALYAEREAPGAFPVDQAATAALPEREMVASLEAQVRALLDEKQELEQALAEGAAALARAQVRARELTSVLVERSLTLR